jgi:hypothetical protein
MALSRASLLLRNPIFAKNRIFFWRLSNQVMALSRASLLQGLYIRRDFS